MMIPIIMGSKSDEDHAQKITRELDRYEIPYVEHVASAHKVPELVLDIVQKYNKSKEAICYITIAGRSNGLSGVVAANAIHPVIACPPYRDKDDFSVNINSTLQMPSQTPVLTIIDPKNAAMAVAKILSLTEKNLKDKIKTEIKEMKNSFK